MKTSQSLKNVKGVSSLQKECMIKLKFAVIRFAPKESGSGSRILIFLAPEPLTTNKPQTFFGKMIKFPFGT
jgi:hypothetical protein